MIAGAGRFAIYFEHFGFPHRLHDLGPSVSNDHGANAWPNSDWIPVYQDVVAALRALAAIRWAKDPTVFPYERAAELARNDDHRVRRSLAQALEVNGAPMSGETQEIIGILRGNVRRSVRTLAWPGPSTTGA
jgi:hypothetical protein